MLDIRKYKKLIGIMLALILLSFFDGPGQNVSLYTPHMTVAAASKEAANEALLVSAHNVPGGADRFVAAEPQNDEVISRDEKPTHRSVIRFIAVVFSLYLAIQMIYHTTIRRYGGHMIDVWENITYIHQTDGKKEDALLCNKATEVLKTGGILWRKIEYLTE